MISHVNRHDEIAELRRNGYVVVRGVSTGKPLARMNTCARDHLAGRKEPFELETDLRYPGAPASAAAMGGQTIRRLLDAYPRCAEFADWATGEYLREWMESYFEEPVRLSRVHHNCVMTKHPKYGSATGWHQDIRYWRFDRDDLVSVWLALGNERQENGGLRFVRGSHKMTLDDKQFDESRFFRADRTGDRSVVRSVCSPQLAPGDAVIFHAKTLHAASQNESKEVKYSVVFSYHGLSNLPNPATRSSAKPEIDV